MKRAKKCNNFTFREDDNVLKNTFFIILLIILLFSPFSYSFIKTEKLSLFQESEYPEIISVDFPQKLYPGMEMTIKVKVVNNFNRKMEACYVYLRTCSGFLLVKNCELKYSREGYEPSLSMEKWYCTSISQYAVSFGTIDPKDVKTVELHCIIKHIQYPKVATKSSPEKIFLSFTAAGSYDNYAGYGNDWVEYLCLDGDQRVRCSYDSPNVVSQKYSLSIIGGILVVILFGILLGYLVKHKKISAYKSKKEFTKPNNKKLLELKKELDVEYIEDKISRKEYLKRKENLEKE